MRNYLFRGKKSCGDDHGWTEGCLSFFSPAVAYIDSEKGITCPVDPDTVGEYFEWCDASGKKIFTGDIVKIDSALIGEVGFDPKRLEYTITARGMLIPFGPFLHSNIEIIGNIYDNPELVAEDEE